MGKVTLVKQHILDPKLPIANPSPCLDHYWANYGFFYAAHPKHSLDLGSNVTAHR
jgi:hypothetical protein